LREQGLSFRAIAGRLGVTAQAAHQLFRYPRRPGLKCRGYRTLVARDRDPARFPGGLYRRACLESKPNVAFAVRLRSLRLAAGLTRSDLAERCGVHPGTIGELERQGRKRPRRSTLERLVRVLGPEVVGKPPD
jgi:transcriptional regulator with XRE-family HTH domain